MTVENKAHFPILRFVPVSFLLLVVHLASIQECIEIPPHLYLPRGVASSWTILLILLLALLVLTFSLRSMLSPLPLPLVPSGFARRAFARSAIYHRPCGTCAVRVCDRMPFTSTYCRCSFSSR